MKIGAQLELCEWQSPTALVERANQFPSSEFFGRACKPYREAWVIGNVGSLIGASRAKLCPGDPPDGYMELGGVEIPVEITECMQDGRRRGDETTGQLRHQGHDELTAAVEKNSSWLERSIKKKIDRDSNYPAGTVLIVYLNTSLYYFDPARTKRECEAASCIRGANIIGSLVYYSGKVYGRSILALAR